MSITRPMTKAELALLNPAERFARREQQKMEARLRYEEKKRREKAEKPAEDTSLRDIGEEAPPSPGEVDDSTPPPAAAQKASVLDPSKPAITPQSPARRLDKGGNNPHAESRLAQAVVAGIVMGLHDIGFPSRR